MTRKHRTRFAPYTTQCRSQLQYFDANEHKSFNNWRDEYVKDSKHSCQDDLPSSQLPKIETQINPAEKQVFAVIDTCSLIKNHQEFINFVTDLRRSYRGLLCPLRFVIPIEVVEELDRCNRPSRKRKSNLNDRENGNQRNQNSDNNGDYPPVGDILAQRDPPRSFMRVIEEELRVFGIILPDFDPGHTIKLQNGNLRQDVEDNNILGSCRRAKIFIDSIKHHPKTKVILITEDNLFKTKATSFGLPSFRWREFVIKFRNFGKKNCNETPTIPSKIDQLNTATTTTAILPSLSTTPKLNVRHIDFPNLRPLTLLKSTDGCPEMEWLSLPDPSAKPMDIEDQSGLGKILPTKEKLSSQVSNEANMRPTSMRIKKMKNRYGNINARLFGTIIGSHNCSNLDNQDDISIVKEVIVVD